MAAFSRGLQPFVHTQSSGVIYPRYLLFSTSHAVRSGHNRWSKIKHDKGSADAKKTAQRAAFAKEIADLSKLYGGDPTTNARLAAVISTSKKAGFPKASIEAAIARGQGVSPTGAALEALTLEALLDSSVALVIDIMTDNRKRTLMELRFLIKNHGGAVTPTSYLFTKRGRVLFDNDEGTLSVDDVLDKAIEADAEDVEENDYGNVVVWTEPGSVTAVAEKLSKTVDFKVKTSEIIWHPNAETLVSLNSGEAAATLSRLIDALRDNLNVQGVYVNATQGDIDEGLWLEIREKLDIYY